MTDAAPRQWTIAEFFTWQDKQPERYELVDGFPVRMMAGAKNVHDDIVVNVLTDLPQPTPRERLVAVHRRRKCGDQAWANPPPGRRR